MEDNDYNPQDAGNSTYQVGDPFCKSPEEIEVLLSDSEKFEIPSYLSRDGNTHNFYFV